MRCRSNFKSKGDVNMGIVTNAGKALVNAMVKNHRYQAHDLFSWLLDDVLADLTGKRKKNPPPIEAIDDIRVLAKLYAECVIESPCCEDVLGPVYEEISSHGQKKWMGQYFTPQPLARMMAKFTLVGSHPKQAGEGLTTVMEPASGSGVMLLAMCQEVIEVQGIEALGRWSLTAVDLDSYCARMTASQLLANCFIHGLTLGELVVYQGNSLFPDKEMTVIVHATASGIDLSEVAPATHPARIEAIEAAANNSIGHGQLEMWG